jgi:hypothetical protein
VLALIATSFDRGIGVAVAERMTRRVMTPRPEPSAQEVLAGLVERVTYHNAENGFCGISRCRLPKSAAMYAETVP